MIDLRSDTLTKPSEAMRQAMAAASVGDDVFDEDPTVHHLQETVAELLGKEAALFVPSGSMGNQIGIRLHCAAGDEFLCEQDAHIFQYEQATFAQLFGVCAQIVPGQGGALSPELLAPRVRISDDHQPRTKLVCLENTHNRLGGRVLPMESVTGTCEWAHSQGLATHLDGARLWNACAATGATPADWAQHFDTVSVCFSKGLGAPIGSALCGPRDLVRQARRVRKAMGGGMRQAGVIAAAAIYAVENNRGRLVEDHQKAQLLAEVVRDAATLTLLDDHCDSNIVIFDVDPQLATAAAFVEQLQDQGVRMLALSPQRVRAVMHLDVSMHEVEQAADRVSCLSSS